MKSELFSSRAYPQLMWLLFALLFSVPSVIRAEDKKPARSSLDEQLLDSLDNELLEGLETVPPDEANAEKKKAGEDASPDVATSDEDTFTRISKRMHEAERLIPKTESAKTTKKLQKEIVADLDQLIAQLEKQCQKCQGGSSSAKPSDQKTAQREQVKQPSQNPSQGQQDSKNPAKDSTERLGKDEARKAALEQMKSLLKADRWGDLPAKDREQMLQLSPEEFLPKYELLIEEYYKRLAEQETSQPKRSRSSR